MGELIQIVIYNMLRDFEENLTNYEIMMPVMLSSYEEDFVANGVQRDCLDLLVGKSITYTSLNFI